MPGEVSGVSGVTNLLGIEALCPVLWMVEGFLVLFPVAVFLSVASLVVRFWRSRGTERQQIKWLTYTGATTAIMIVLTNLLDQDSALYTVMDCLTGLVQTLQF